MPGDDQPLPVSAEDVAAAAAAIAGAVVTTEFAPSLTLSKITGAELRLKFENQQFTASFKERGALNKLLNLSEEERRVGVIAMSAGNHAQGVAYHAERLGIAATIVMPSATPFIKVQHTKDFGAEVVLYGDSLEEANRHAHGPAAERGLTFIHPYDDPHVIAGQGTVAVEMLADWPEMEVLVVPVGGGGLIGGMAVAAKTQNPDIQVIGVEAASYPAMYNHLKGTELPSGGPTIAEGIAVARVGQQTEALVRALVDDILLVDEEQIEQALCLFLMVEKTLVEGAGAAGLAALLAEPERFAGRKVGLVLSGGNIDQRLLSTVLLRDLFRQGRMARLRVPLGDFPGELARVTSIIGAHGGNIVDVVHRRTLFHVPAKVATAEFAIETRDPQQMETIREKLVEAGLKAELVPDDE